MSTLDRAAIFRSAHKHARRELTWGGREWTYRKAFSIPLRAVYSAAEMEAAEERAWLATLPTVPPEIEERACESAMAAGCRIDGPGNEMFSRLKAQARDLIDAARGLN